MTWFPILLVVENWQAYGSRGIDVGVGQNGMESAFGWPYWVVVREIHDEVVGSSKPRAIFGSRNLAIPLQKILGSISIGHGFSNKAKRMIGSPLLSLFFQSVDNQLADAVFLHTSFKIMWTELQNSLWIA